MFKIHKGSTRTAVVLFNRLVLKFPRFYGLDSKDAWDNLKGKWKEEGFDSIFGTGVAYGAGADFAVSDRLTIGVEYLWRNFDTENFASAVPQIANTHVEGDFGTLSLRVAFRF